MIILHNSYDRESREFVAANPGATVYDWYEGGREAWVGINGTIKVSAFPSVIVDVPAFTIPARVDADGKVVPAHNVPPEQIAVRKPRNLADVQTRLDELNERLPVAARLNLNNMNDAPTGRAEP